MTALPEYRALLDKLNVCTDPYERDGLTELMRIVWKRLSMEEIVELSEYGSRTPREPLRTEAESPPHSRPNARILTPVEVAIACRESKIDAIATMRLLRGLFGLDSEQARNALYDTVRRAMRDARAELAESLALFRCPSCMTQLSPEQMLVRLFQCPHCAWMERKG